MLSTGLTVHTRSGETFCTGLGEMPREHSRRDHAEFIVSSVVDTVKVTVRAVEEYILGS